MYRSWAYILMIAATLVGIVALVWPSPQVQTIEQIATASRDTAPRAEAPVKPVRPAAKAVQPARPGVRATEPAPPVVKRMPAPNTSTQRATTRAVPDNGMQPSPFANLNPDAPAAAAPKPPVPPAPRAGVGMPKPPSAPPRPPLARSGTNAPAARRDPAAK